MSRDGDYNIRGIGKKMKILIKVIEYESFLFLSIMIHELGHVLVCLLLGVKVYGFVVSMDKYIAIGVLRAKTTVINSVLIASAGFIFQLLILLILLIVSYKKKYLFLYVCCLSASICSIFHWYICLVLGFGDSHKICLLLNYSYLQFTLISFIISSFIIILLVKGFVNICNIIKHREKGVIV